MTTETVFTHDDKGNLQLRRPEAWDRRIRDVEGQIATQQAEINELAASVRMLSGLLQRVSDIECALTNPLRDGVTLAGIREDRG